MNRSILALVIHLVLSTGLLHTQVPLSKLDPDAAAVGKGAVGPLPEWIKTAVACALGVLCLLLACMIFLPKLLALFRSRVMKEDNDELLPSNRGHGAVKYTEADFPCPPAMPGTKTSVGSHFCDFEHKPGEVAFAVVQPHPNASSTELKTIGERLQTWKAGNAHIKRILGLEPLLQGTLPILRADMFSLAARSDRVSVALIYVTESADNETTGKGLLQVMAGLSVSVVSPGYFSKLRE